MNVYKKHFCLFRNKAIQRELEHLDPVKDHCRMVHLLAGYEFPWDGVRALEVALMRTFCSPSISALLHRTGEFHRHGQKRYDDTALLIAEFMQHGYDSDRGRTAIVHMNKLHGFYAIKNEDFLYVLSTFIFQPFWWNEHYGWRRLCEKEKLATFYFFREVGVRMHLKDLPDSLPAFANFAKAYEQRHFAYADTNRKVADATLNVVKGWMPFFLKPFIKPIMTCFLDDAMLQAFGYAAPPVWLKAGVKIAMKLRAGVLRYITFKSYPYFITNERNRTYPKGYEIEHLGPGKLVKKR
jgi:hypothetical protein